MSELHFLKNPYHSENITDKKAKSFCKKLAFGRLFGEKVAVCLSLNENDELDLINFREIRGPLAGKFLDYYVVGVATDEEDALEVARIIVQDVIDKSGEPKIKDYFKKEELW